jgi:hypothetical protein
VFAEPAYTRNGVAAGSCGTGSAPMTYAVDKVFIGAILIRLLRELGLPMRCITLDGDSDRGRIVGRVPAAG